MARRRRRRSAPSMPATWRYPVRTGGSQYLSADGFGKRGRPRPAEPHPLVAGHVDEECARRESRKIVFRHEDSVARRDPAARS